MPISNRLLNQHLLWRAGFGQKINHSADLDSLSPKETWNRLLKSSSGTTRKIITSTISEEEFFMSRETEMGEMSRLTPEQRKAFGQQSRADIRKLNTSWLSEMINSEAQLREKMSLFWHGHFACRIDNIYFQQNLLNTIRQNALGNFGVLLKEVSKSPSMLQFLNNQQNRKKHPNENFAREVMELFTMGRGNYTEKDIQESARAFTGWSYNPKGEFVFKENQHDDGSKTFLGKTGDFNGDDILTILLEQKQTARFITKKIFRFLVNEQPDEARINQLAERFFKTGYDIKKLLEDIFTSDWFFAEKNIGTKIKSPVELIAGLRRMLPMEMEDDGAQILIQRALGQVLFNPPNVAGWPGGKTWIDSSTLMLRLTIPRMLAADELFSLSPKSDDDTMMGNMKEERIAKRERNRFIKSGGTAKIDWTGVVGLFEKVSRENLLASISNSLLQTKSRISADVIENYLLKGSREEYIKSVYINYLSTPEYQLC